MIPTPVWPHATNQEGGNLHHVNTNGQQSVTPVPPWWAGTGCNSGGHNLQPHQSLLSSIGQQHGMCGVPAQQWQSNGWIAQHDGVSVGGSSGCSFDQSTASGGSPACSSGDWNVPGGTVQQETSTMPQRKLAPPDRAEYATFWGHEYEPCTTPDHASTPGASFEPRRAAGGGEPDLHTVLHWMATYPAGQPLWTGCGNSHAAWLYDSCGSVGGVLCRGPCGGSVNFYKKGTVLIQSKPEFYQNLFSIVQAWVQNKANQPPSRKAHRPYSTGRGPY